MTKNKKEYRTADLSLTASLCVSGFVIEKIERVSHTRSVFIFQDSSELQEAVNSYWGDTLQVKPQAFFNQLKILKTRIYER